MQHLRIGSTVSIQYVTYNSSGGSSATNASGLVSNITDSYIEVEDASGVGKVIPWSNAKFVNVTSD